MIKSLSLLTRRPEFSHEQFVKHWLEIHGPLALVVPGLRRYVQSHIIDERTRPDIPATDVASMASPRLGTTIAPRWTAPTPRLRPRLCTPTAPSSSAASRASSPRKR